MSPDRWQVEVETVEKWAWVEAIDDKRLLVTRGLCVAGRWLAALTTVTGIAHFALTLEFGSLGSASLGVCLLAALTDLRALHAAIGRATRGASGERQ